MIDQMVLIAWKNKLPFLGSFSYSYVLCPTPGKIVRQATTTTTKNPKQQIPKSERLKLPPALADFCVMAYHMRGFSLATHTKAKADPALSAEIQ